MDKSELAYVVYVKVYEDTPKVRQDIEKSLNKICGLAFDDVQVDDANDMGVV